MEHSLPDCSPWQETATYYRFNFFDNIIDKIEKMPHSEAFHFNLDLYDRNINCRWVSISVAAQCLLNFVLETIQSQSERAPE